jgi:hypothetical protein
MRIITLFLAGIIASCSVQTGPFSRLKPDDNRSYSRASFLPENDYATTKHYYSAGEVTEEDFNLAMDAAIEIYTPIFNNLGLNLTIQGDFFDETVNAYCSRNGNDVTVQMFGGLAKQPQMTLEGFALVICHELGHAVAGKPLYSNNDWASVEGQSDQFATAVCARKMFDPSSPINYRILELMRRKNPKQPTNCASFKGIDKQVCELALSGGLSLGSVLASLNDEPTPKYETPSKVVVKKTMEAHPDSQCRLDTYKVGALCNKTWNDSIIPSTKAQENAVNCDRPKCWYKS